mgnify:FL=1
MSIEKLFSKRRQIRAAWDQTRLPSKETIKDLLERTMKIAPSKQNLYPFKIHAFGPNNEKEKRIVEKICCLYTQGSVNDFNLSRDQLKAKGADENLPGWILVFEQRLCKPNTFIKEYSQMYKGDSPYITPGDVQGTASRFAQISEKRFRGNTNKALACIEVGMFTKILAGLCLENELAISYIKSFPEWNWKDGKGEYSKNKNKNGLDWDALPQITEAPILVVQIGYKADMIDPLSSTVEVDGVIHSTKGGVLLEDKPSIDDVVRFNK